MTKINRKRVVIDEVDIPDDHETCRICKGRGLVSRYDLGHHSLGHVPDMAALRTCTLCLGKGSVPAHNEQDELA